MKKLLNKRGETLTESLIALLITVLSAAMFATMVTAAVNIGSKADAAVEEFYEELSAAEAGSIPESGTLEVNDRDFTVEYYRRGDGLLTAYRSKAG